MHYTTPLAHLPPLLGRRFVVEAPLGAGGMGEVWRVFDRLLGRPVALKLVRPGREGERARLAAEFALLAELNHPGVVHVHEVGQTETGAAWMVSELADGERLDHWAASAPPTHARAGVARDLLATLAWLHGHGLVHGDLKPANILIVQLDGQPWPLLIDFGLALEHAAPGAQMLGGTSAYLAPELLQRGARPTPASDLFALGRCLAPLASDDPPLLALVTALTAPAPASRPADADAALAVLDHYAARVNGAASHGKAANGSGAHGHAANGPAPGGQPADASATRRGIPRPGRLERGDGAGAPIRHLGARGHAALWPDATLRGLVEAVGRGGTHHRVLLPAAPDAPSFAATLKAALDLAGHPAWVLSARPGAAIASLDALLACVEPVASSATAPSGSAVSADHAAGPDDHRALLDARADAAITALRGAPDLPTLIVTASADGQPPDDATRFLLARLIEAGVVPAVVLVHGRATTVALGRGVDPALLVHDVPDPTGADLDRFLARHGVVLPLPERARALLEARLGAGAAPLRALLALWRRVGALSPVAGGQWVVDGAASALSVDAPDLDSLWAELWHQLSPASRAVVIHLHELGGAAPLAALEELATGALREALADLGPPGWLSVEPGPLARLGADVDRRIASGALSRPILPSAALRRRYVELLRAEPETEPGVALALARQLEALGEDRAAADPWRRAGEALARRHAPIAAGRAWLSAARAAERAGERARALRDADTAARWFDAGGALADLTDVVSFARELADRLGDPDAREAARLIAARAAIRAGEPKGALEAVEGLDPAATTTPARAFDVALARGTALAQLGQQDEAAAALADAADRADALGDLHAVGRVANNLGIVAFHRGDFDAAANAWARSASAKARTGDLRGRRIAMSNRGLALRELDRLEEAYAAITEAADLAERIGDTLGVAMGHLALAQLALDLGAPARAVAALDAFDRAPATSALMRGDAGVLRARALVAAGDAAGGAGLAAGTWSDARAQGLDTVAEDAWLVTYASWVRADRPRGDLAAAVEDALGDDPVARAAALVTGERGADPLRLACLAHAEARAGRWDEARARLATLLEALGAARPAATPAFDLANRLCRLLADAAGADRLDAVGARLLAARRDTARAVYGEDAPSAEELARHLGLTAGEETARIVQELDATIRPQGVRPAPATGAAAAPREEPTPTLTATQQLLLATFDALAPGPFGATSAWAEALWRATGASRCELVGYDDEGATVLARAGRDAGGPDRFLEVARALRGGGAPFVAERAADGLEALGLPLAATPGEPPVGSLFLAFDDRSASRDLVSAVAPAASCAALAVGHDLARRALADAQRDVTALTAQIEEQVRAHRDEVTALRDALDQSHSELGLRYEYDRIVHRSQALRRVLQTLDKVTDNDLPVLILGESGVGKELLARALHFNGPRRARPFVAENCGAVPPDLFESVFFGHARGAFTGAHAARRGLLEQADGGTLFLDEIGELPLEHQVKLLRALQERRFRPVGAQRELGSDFRLVAATNRDLPQLVRDGRFREDLYYRVAVVTIDVPPLRARPEDILPLAERFLEQITARTGQPLRLTPAAANVLAAHAWPGNVRELDNEIQRAAVLCGGEPIRPAHFSPRLFAASAPTSPTGSVGVAIGSDRPLADLLGDVERQAIIHALTRTEGKKAAAARLLGLSRPGLDAKLERHVIDVGEFKSTS